MLIASLFVGLSMTECTILDDFASQPGRWVAVNDGVMGGRSSGGPLVEGERLLFQGTINTDGGGFSSIRREVDPGTMVAATSIRAVLRGDGRGYELIFQTSERYRGRRVTYRAPLTSERHPDFTTVTASLDGMPATVFGAQVRAAPFDPGDAREIGIMLADGRDGDFRLEVQSVAVCR